MENGIKKNITRYSGLKLKALILFAKSKISVNKIRQREVWQEIFHRYFNEGRNFNLYNLLINEPIYFAITIGIELKHENVIIPESHTEDFIKSLLNFIIFMDKKVLESTNIQFEWQLHELAGIKSMIEKVRDVKIQDNVLRQQINLFIDRINNSRKSTLLLIEESKVNVKDTETSIVLKAEVHALMKQELKRLDIPLAKTKKEDFLKMLEKLKIYYPEDQVKIINYGLKKYWSETSRTNAWMSFVQNLNSKCQDVKMNFVLGMVIEQYQNNKIKLTDIINTNEWKDFFIYFKNFYLSANGSSLIGYEIFIESIYELLKKEEINSDFYNDILVNKLTEGYNLLKIYKGANLSTLLTDTIKKNKIQKKSYCYSNIMYSKEKSNWFVSELGHDDSTKKQKELTEDFSILKYLFNLLDILKDRNGMFEYSGDIVDNNKITLNHGFSHKLMPMITEICNFVKTINIDKELLNTLDKSFINGYISSYDKNSEEPFIKWFFRYKFCQNSISDKEIELLFTNEKMYKIFKTVTSDRQSQGKYKYHTDYLYEYIEQSLHFFDFTKENDLRTFFRLEFDPNDFFHEGRVSNNETIAYSLIEKLHAEIPHEFILIEDYFSDMEENEYTEINYFDEYKHLSDLEKFLLSSYGHNIGEEVTKKGIRVHGKLLTAEQAQSLFIIQYFKEMNA